MNRRYNILLFGIVAATLSSTIYAAGYISVGGAGKHGYGHISIGHGGYGYGGYGRGHIRGHGNYLAGGFYAPPIITHGYSSYCYGVYCGGGVHYIRSAPSIDYFRGLSDAASSVNCIGCTPGGIAVVPGVMAVPVTAGTPTVIIRNTPSNSPETCEDESE